MKYAKLNMEAKIPLIGLGTWKSSAGEVYSAVRWALKLGYTHFDCASIYGNQAEIGQAFHDAFNEDNLKREDLFITSKLWNDSHAPEDVLPALKQTLHDLQCDYLDLWLMHWPIAQRKNTDTPTSETDIIPLSELPLEVTWAEMEKAYNSGLVKAIGVSNFGVKNLQRLLDNGSIAPAVNQVECHPYLQQTELLDFCSKNLSTLTAYSSLGSSDRAGALKRQNEPKLLEDKTISEIATRLNATPAQVILAWLMQRGIVVIPKSVHENHLRENLASLNITLDESDMQKIGKLDRDYRYLDGKPFSFGGYTPENIFS